MDRTSVMKSYLDAKEYFAEIGIDTDKAIEKTDEIPVSMHCWQGDDLIGFDGIGELTGGIATTGNYPGRARNADELRRDIEKAISLFPGVTKISIHACHAEKSNKNIDRDQYSIAEFQTWTDWAKDKNYGLDFNPTFFSHPKMDGDFSLSSLKKEVREFWIEHGRRSWEISEEIAKQLGKPCLVNYWMPDGFKDTPADTVRYRELMTESLDAIFSGKTDEKLAPVSVESKLFGLGLESYTVVNHEYALGYALTREKLYTLDAGHFHPTETISSKISPILQFLPRIMLHVSRGVRWDSDHVVTLTDELQAIMDEIIFNSYVDRVSIGLDYFDASINRIACWVIGVRNVRKALLSSELTPVKRMREAEYIGDFTSRLALQEERRSLPVTAVWNYYCLTKNIPVGTDWIKEMKNYEKEVLSFRN